MPAIRWESKSLSEQPLVLCGPMLRKVTANEVNVFIALKENRQVKLQVFTTAGSVKGDSGWVDPVKLGNNLYVINLTANITSPDLSPQTVYAYNVFFMGSSGLSNLSSADILKYGQSGTKPLVYSNSPTVGGIQLPSFVIPANEINDLWILHGSCRKPHGEGFDAMDGVNDIIESAVNSSTSNIRPQLLCLTGDQVYSDDVADSLLYMIQNVALDFLPDLWDEIPSSVGIQSKDNLDKDIKRKYGSKQLPTNYDKNNLYDQNFFSAGLRRTFITDACGFNSYKVDKDGVDDPCKSHLIKFCEFVAMYLFAWNDVLWEGTAPGLPTWDQVHKNLVGINGDIIEVEDTEVVQVLEAVPYTTREKFVKKTFETSHKKHFDLENTRLLRFKATLHRVRKALANISSLMIMDDHEITDDLFYNHQWNTDVENSAYGKKLITNGLAAYTIFQQWGNTPEQFSSGVGQTFLNHVENYASNIINIETVLYPNMAIRPHLLISQETPYNGFKVTVVNYTPPQKITFNFIYSYPNNKYELIFLDTRRERASMYGDNRPPSIIDPAAVTVQIANTSSFARKDLSIVANALPFLGSKHFEAVKSISGGIESRSTTVGYEKLLGLDMEGWEPFEDHVLFYYTLDRLIGRSTSTSTNTPHQHRVVFLGGDVHFAFSKSIEMLYHKGFIDNSIPVGSQLKVASLCASSFKNETNQIKGTKYMHKITLAEAILGVDPIGPEAFYFFGWNNLKKIEQTLTITDNSNIPPSIQKTIYQIPHIFKKSDFIIKHSTGGFPPTPPVIKDYSNGLQNPLPDFEGKVSIVNNNFNRDFDATALNNDTNLSNKSQILSEHKKYALDKDKKNGYVFVGKNNFGEITFNWNNGNAPEDKLVIHNLWWRDNEWENKDTPTIPPNNINIRTRHVISLNFEP